VAVFNKYFLIVAAAVIMPAAAQQTGRPLPSDPAAAVPPARYESAFGAYVPHSEPKIAPWRNVNDEAARIGGHAGVLRQSGMHGGKPAAGSAMPGHGTGHK